MGQGEADVVQHRHAVGVGEGHVLVLHVTLHVVQLYGIGLVDDIRLGVHDLAETLEAGHAVGEGLDEKIKVLQEADAVLRDEIKKSGIESELKQFFAVLPDVKTVGVMGDHRTYDHLIAIRAITTDDFMTADWAKIPYDILARVSNRICNEVEHVNRVVYDITSKPPGTVEWE